MLAGSSSEGIDITLLTKEVALASSFAVADAPHEYLAFDVEAESVAFCQERAKTTRSKKSATEIRREVNVAQTLRRDRNHTALANALSQVRRRLSSLALPTLSPFTFALLIGIAHARLS